MDFRNARLTIGETHSGLTTRATLGELLLDGSYGTTPTDERCRELIAALLPATMREAGTVSIGAREQGGSLIFWTHRSIVTPD